MTMKSRQNWITIGTAMASFALGVALAPSLLNSDEETVAGVRQTKPSNRSPAGSLSGDAEEITRRTRSAKKDDGKKGTEPRITLPLATFAETFKQQLWTSQIQHLGSQVEKCLPLLEVSEQEKSEILELFKKFEADVYAEEKKRLKVFSADQTQIRLDNSAMAEPFRSFATQTQESIRAILPQDKAEILVSSVRWNEMYRTSEAAYPKLTIERSSSGRMTGWARDLNGGNGYAIDPRFADDGTPIPAEEAFKDNRWKPFLKGLTLLPQNEE